MVKAQDGSGIHIKIERRSDPGYHTPTAKASVEDSLLLRILAVEEQQPEAEMLFIIGLHRCKGGVIQIQDCCSSPEPCSEVPVEVYGRDKVRPAITVEIGYYRLNRRMRNNTRSEGLCDQCFNVRRAGRGK